MSYKTQMQAAKLGIVTEQMAQILKDEFIHEDTLLERVAKGEIAIPANKNHTCLHPRAVGTGTRTKINVNLGVSGDMHNYEVEYEKAMLAEKFCVDGIMDLSNCGKTDVFRKKLIDNCKAMIGTVPIYDAVGYLEKDLKAMSASDFLTVIEAHAKQGVDFMTIHAGINRRTIESFERSSRITNIVSRGGSLIFAWMRMTGNENPFFEHFDKVLDILHEYDVTISLGDALRPGCTNDSSDQSQIQELLELGYLTKRAFDADVQVMIEGPGHMAINEIEANMRLEKRLCHNAPFYCLGPLVTDIAPGYDHITSAIGGAIAATHGCDFLCYVTPAEHLRLPSLEDVKEGIVAYKIAAHAADIAKGYPHARDIDNKMSEYRQRIDWEGMFSCAIDEQKARDYFNSAPPTDLNSCSMCGKMCACKTVNAILEGKDITLI